jgi:hypothetical protein
MRDLKARNAEACEDYKGYKVAVAPGNCGTYCGYFKIPKEHPLFGADYLDLDYFIKKEFGLSDKKVHPEPLTFGHEIFQGLFRFARKTNGWYGFDFDHIWSIGGTKLSAEEMAHEWIDLLEKDINLENMPEDMARNLKAERAWLYKDYQWDSDELNLLSMMRKILKHDDIELDGKVKDAVINLIGVTYSKGVADTLKEEAKDDKRNKI